MDGVQATGPTRLLNHGETTSPGTVPGEGKMICMLHHHVWVTLSKSLAYVSLIQKTQEALTDAKTNTI